MEMKKIVQMNAGNGETSYAKNSRFQNVVISKTWGLLDETLINMLEKDELSDCCFNMVDLGCASGPNSLSVVAHVMDTIQDLRKNGNNSQEFRYFLNDLPCNDFNGLFELVESEKEVVCGPRSQCYIYGLPGSFYTRLFPRKSLHFAYSSTSLQWLSQVPQGLERQNKENIFITMTSPPEVLDAYAAQYKRDWFTFLSLRAEEMVPGGRMVLTFINRSVDDFSAKEEYAHYDILAQMLLDMVTQGLLEKDDLYSFNVPIYMPCKKEVESIINQQGSFKIDKIFTFQVRWDIDEDADGFDENRRVKFATNIVRAFMEPMLVSHFGKLIDCDVLFERFSWKIGECSKEKKLAQHILAISLKRDD